MGPLTYRDSFQNASFVADINNLKAKGGGDCPELTFSGILTALETAPTKGSPLYVFTDATAKDNNLVDDVINFATRLDVTINFFVTGRKIFLTSSYKGIVESCSRCRNFELRVGLIFMQILHVKNHVRFLHS